MNSLQDFFAKSGDELLQVPFGKMRDKKADIYGRCFKAQKAAWFTCKEQWTHFQSNK